MLFSLVLSMCHTQSQWSGLPVISLWCNMASEYGPLARYAKLRATHTPKMPGTFSPPLWVSDPDMQHGTCVAHVSWCMPGSLTIGFLWNRWRGIHSRHSRRMRNPQFCVSGKRPMRNYIQRMAIHKPWQSFSLSYWFHISVICSLFFLVWVVITVLQYASKVTSVLNTQHQRNECYLLET